MLLVLFKLVELEFGELLVEDTGVIPLLTTILDMSSKSTTPPCTSADAASESNLSVEIVVAAVWILVVDSKFKLLLALGPPRAGTWLWFNAMLKWE